MFEALGDNLAAVRSGILHASERAGREPDEVTLVAVTKTLPIEAVELAVSLGIRDFGENYVNELRGKARDLPDVRWHYVGALQSGTAKYVADIASFVHGLEPGGAVAKLAERAAARGRVLPVLIQVDYTGERHGVAPEDLSGLAREVASMDGLLLSGLMTLPPMPESPEDCRPFFRRLRQMRDGLAETFPQVVELSMGMSLDYEVAVEEGATMVRIGTALFGERMKR